jgi:hypothetical protein
MLPKVLFNFERQPSQIQNAPRRGERKSEGCCHFTWPEKGQHKKRPAIPADLSAFILFQVKLQCYTAEGNPEDPLTRHYIESLERE